MYTISLILPSTERGKEILADKYADVLAKIALKKLNLDELKILIDRLENKEQ